MGYRPLPSLGSVGQALRNTSSGTAIWGAPRIIDITKAPYNADPTGAVDAAAAFNSAFALNGVTVTAPAGSVFKINSTVNIGDGSVSQISTTMGQQLRGEGYGGAPGYSGTLAGFYSPVAGMTLKWGGASGAGPILRVNGPQIGWAISDIVFDANDLVDHGVELVSAQNGEMLRCHIVGANTHGLYTTTVGNFGGVNTMHNRFQQLTVTMHDVQAAGIGLYSGAGPSGIMSNTYGNVFDDIIIRSTTSLTGGKLQWGIFLDCCDTNAFHNIVCYDWSGRYALGLGYLTSSGQFPNANFIENIDTGGGGYVAYGSIGASAPNKIVNINPTNGGSTTNPSVSGLTWGYTACNP